MNLYFAPLEGITSYVYRNTHKKMFGGCDAYFAPFINPTEQYKISRKGVKDIFPENNEGINLKVQVLTNKAQSFLRFAEEVKKIGYDEVNINLGCPASTVVKKGRGSGFLQNLKELEKFFDDIFSECDIKVSVKTRSGFNSGEEMKELMKIYNKYPLSLLIIHPRAREDYYNGEPDKEVFGDAYKISSNKVCYNGNIYTAQDYKDITAQFPDIEGVMLGRGAIKNPAIFREIRGGNPITTFELIEFTHRLIDNYIEVLKSDTYTMYKMKEIWFYMMWNFPQEKKISKAIKKAARLSDFVDAIKLLPEIER